MGLLNCQDVYTVRFKEGLEYLVFLRVHICKEGKLSRSSVPSATKINTLPPRHAVILQWCSLERASVISPWAPSTSPSGLPPIRAVTVCQGPKVNKDLKLTAQHHRTLHSSSKIHHEWLHPIQQPLPPYRNLRPSLHKQLKNSPNHAVFDSKYHYWPVLGKVTFKSNALQYCVTP